MLHALTLGEDGDRNWVSSLLHERGNTKGGSHFCDGKQGLRAVHLRSGITRASSSRGSPGRTINRLESVFVGRILREHKNPFACCAQERTG